MTEQIMERLLARIAIMQEKVVSPGGDNGRNEGLAKRDEG
jgi:hypothetical protein